MNNNNIIIAPLKQYGFADHYELKADGNIVNTRTNRTIKPTNNRYWLKDSEGKRISISIKKLYKLIYNINYCQDNTKDQNGEVWKEFDQYYLVSNHGRVKSLKGYNARILKQYPNSKGYNRVIINGKKILVHRMVAQLFVENDEPQKNIIIHHKDSNKKNNNAINLQWVTYKQNAQAYQERKRNERHISTTRIR